MEWFFLALGCLTGLVACTPRWRRHFGWGRTGAGGPLSLFGWLSWIATFFIISAVGFHRLTGWWVLGAFVSIMASGLADSIKNSKRSKPVEDADGPPDRTQQGTKSSR